MADDIDALLAPPATAPTGAPAAPPVVPQPSAPAAPSAAPPASGQPQPPEGAGGQVDPALAAALGQQAAPGAPPQADPSGGGQVDPALAAALGDGAGGAAGAAAPPAAGPDTSPALTPDATDSPSVAAAKATPGESGGLGPAAAQFGLGAVEGLFHGYDFFAGEPKQADKSDFRKTVEARTARLNEANPHLGPLAQGLGQLGAGLLATEPLGAAAGLAGGAKFAAAAGPGVVGAGKAAVASYLSLDPHSGNIANLVDTYAPSLSNPVTEALSAHPDDSAATGRLKNAVSSIFGDAAVGSIIKGTVALSRAARAYGGASKEATNALNQIGRGQEAAGAGGAPDGVPPGGPAADAGGSPAAPANENAPRPNANDNQPTAAPANDAAVPQVGNDNAPGAATGAPQNEAPQATPGPAGAPRADTTVTLAGKEMSLGDSARSFLDDADAKSGGGTAAMPAGGAPVGDAAGVGVRPAAEGNPAAGGAVPSARSTVQPNLTTAQRGLPAPLKVAEVPDEMVASLLDKAKGDTQALADAGGNWQQAIQNHDFGAGAQIPWQKLSTTDEADASVARAVDALQVSLDAAKGGDVLSDARVAQLTQARLALYNEDPAAMLGAIRASGKNASRMVAEQEAATYIATKINSDMAALAARISAGDLTAYGGDLTAAHADLSRRLSMFQAAYGASQSIKANAGRVLRRQRADFALDPATMNALRNVDPALLAKTISGFQGDPAKLASLTPSLMSRLNDWAGYMYIGNLLSRPETQWVNIASMGVTMAQRPAERIIGSFATGAAGASIRDQAVRQYYYMAASMMDGWQAAKRAFIEGDSRIAPHQQDIQSAMMGGPQDTPSGLPYQPGDSVETSNSNTLLSALGPMAWKALALGPRLIGAADEMAKTIVYRSMVLSKAQVEGEAAARAANLFGDEGKSYVGQFVKQRMADAFDANGFATDMAAKYEAQVATHSQPLLDHTLGKLVQTGAANVPGMKFIVPFVKTPTNLVRYGVKLTPGLNMLQTEFRQQFMGAMGPELQAQARGQMGLAMGAMTTAAYLASQGVITGSGPADPQARKELMATGWKPYSVVIRVGSQTHYVSYGRYDPIAIPIGIAADLQHLWAHPNVDDSVASATGATMLALSKNLADKSYLTSISNLIEAIGSGDPRKAQRWIGQQMAGMVPLSSGQKFITNTFTDGYLRDARSITDNVIAQTPGLSATLPPRRNWAGDPERAQPVLMGTSADSPSDTEIQRLALEQGSEQTRSLTPPSPQLGGHTDLRQLTLKDGRDAYDAYQDYAGHPPGAPPLKDVVNKLMTSQAYRDAPDGPSQVEGTKLHMIEGPIRDYRSAAKQWISADPNVAQALYADRVKVSSAYATRLSDPSGGRQQAQSLNDIGTSFGVNLGLPTK